MVSSMLSTLLLTIVLVLFLEYSVSQEEEYKDTRCRDGYAIEADKTLVAFKIETGGIPSRVRYKKKFSRKNVESIGVDRNTGQFYAISRSDSTSVQLNTLNVKTGKLKKLMKLSGVGAVTGMAVSTKGLIYVISEADDRLYEIDPLKLVQNTKKIGKTGIMSKDDVNDLAMDSKDTLYATDADLLYRINIQNGNTKKVGKAKKIPGIGSIRAIMFDNKDSFWGYSMSKDFKFAYILKLNPKKFKDWELVSTLDIEKPRGAVIWCEGKFNW